MCNEDIKAQEHQGETESEAEEDYLSFIAIVLHALARSDALSKTNFLSPNMEQSPGESSSLPMDVVGKKNSYSIK